MSISFSGLGSGMDYSTWVTQLTALKEQSIVTPLETKKTNLQSQNSAISSLKTYYMTLAKKFPIQNMGHLLIYLHQAK